MKGADQPGMAYSGMLNYGGNQSLEQGQSVCIWGTFNHRYRKIKLDIGAVQIPFRGIKYSICAQKDGRGGDQMAAGVIRFIKGD